MRIAKAAVFALAAGGLSLANSATAYEAGDILLRFGPATVAPDASSDKQINAVGGEIDVNDDTQLGITATYMFSEWFGMELLAATPYEHNLYAEDGNGRDLIGETKHLPPTLLAQFHLPGSRKFNPYVGLGVNHTVFFEENLRDQNSRGIPAGFSVELSDSTGLATEVGVDVALQGDWFLNASVWQLDIDTTATVEDASGARFDKIDVEIDPVVWMLGVGRSF